MEKKRIKQNYPNWAPTSYSAHLLFPPLPRPKSSARARLPQNPSRQTPKRRARAPVPLPNGPTAQSLQWLPDEVLDAGNVGLDVRTFPPHSFRQQTPNPALRHGRPPRSDRDPGTHTDSALWVYKYQL